MFLPVCSSITKLVNAIKMDKLILLQTGTSGTRGRHEMINFEVSRSKVTVIRGQIGH